MEGCDTDDYQPQRAGGNLDLPRQKTTPASRFTPAINRAQRRGELSDFLQRNVIGGNARASPIKMQEKLYVSGSTNVRR